MLPIGESTVVRLTQLLDGERRQRRTRRGRRALGPWQQAILVLRWWSYPWSSAALVPVSLVYTVFHVLVFIGILGFWRSGIAGTGRAAQIGAIAALTSTAVLGSRSGSPSRSPTNESTTRVRA
jgi:hypothetical protein